MAIIQQPTSLSLLGNLQKFVVASSAPVSFKLYDAGTLLADELYEAPLSGNISIDVSQLIKERLSFTLSATNFYQQTSIVKQFSAVVDGQTINFSVIRAGVANLADTPTNWLKANFLTWQPTTKAVSYHSPEWLTYYATQSATLKLKAYFSDDTSSIITLGSFSAGQAFTANVQYAVIAGLLGNKYPTHYDVWVEASSTPLTYTQRYYYSQPKAKSEQWYLFENSLGGIDTIRTSGASTFSGSHSHDLSQIDNTVSELNVTTVRFYTQNTGALDADERQWLKDFFASSKKYIHHNGAFRTIVLTEDSAQYSTIDLPSSFNFTFRFADDTVGLLNLVRNSSAIPPVITVPNLSLPNFTIPPRLSEFPRVDLGEGVIIPAFDPNSDTPSVTTVGALIAAAAVEILKQVPGNTPGGSGQLVTLIRLASEFAGSDDDVFSSSRTLAEIQRLINAIPKYWKEDEFGNIYCERNVYSHQGITAYRGGDTEDDEPDELFVSLTLTEQFVATLIVNEFSALLSLKGHQHTAEDITDLLDIFYTQTQIDTLLSNIDVGGGDGGVADSVDWANITNKPSTFPPSSHTHSQYLTAHQSLTHLATKTELAGKADTSHTHAISNITNLATELAAKAPLNNPEFTGVPKAPVFQAPKFNLGNNWTMEGENGEVVLKLSGVIKFRLTADGFISVGGIAAYGASTGDGVSDDFLKKDSAETQTVNSKVVFANDVDFTDKDVTTHSLNITNTAVVKDLETGTVKIGQTWSAIEDANGNLVFKKNGVIKHTING